MNRFATRVQQRLVELLVEAGKTESVSRLRLHAVSLWVEDDGDDPRRPGVMLGLEWEPEEPQDRARWLQDAELQWNFAAWSQTCDAYFGPDEAQIELVGIETDRCTETFVRWLIDAVQQVHRERITELAFGRRVPLLIHELEYYQEIARQNVEANGYETVSDFVAWIRPDYERYAPSELPAFDLAIQAADRSFALAMTRP